ncbi:MAG TPA: cyclopropane-fatty-acyl-phospholipid synthase family protein [Caulobacteraceae bacterium]|nr:cyclopropane-fatty-acyl-phospholipid synthase family protein [Caulobacteraceae bacterium]
MLDAFLKRLIKVGDLTVVEAGGRTGRYGDGSGEPVRVRLGPGAVGRLGRQPELALGECYMDGSLVIEQGDMGVLMELLGRNMGSRRRSRNPLRVAELAIKRRLQQMNYRRRARANVAHHYDLSYDLYRRFLDADMQYSCAYFPTPETSLEDAQTAKKAHLAAKLLLQPGHKVLDIGCGWGGLGLSLAEAAPGAKVTGVTLSKEQLAVARRRAQERGLADRVDFQLRDYRDLTGTFDRIVSVGMFEHVGQPYFQEFFDDVARLLPDDGVMVLHSIGRKEGPSVTNPFINKYIFPGGYVPALSEVIPCIEKAGLFITDIEILRVHYAETLKAWRSRFLARYDEIHAVYDDRFMRMWDYYLASSEISFRHLGHMNFQIQLAKRVDTVPLTRDYIGEAEAALRSVVTVRAANTDEDDTAAA